MEETIEHRDRGVEAARRVLAELMLILGEYSQSMVLIGGWVPYFHFGKTHIGSTDVDIAIDPRTIGDEQYATIREHLEKHGYVGTKRYAFERTVEIEGESIAVDVEFFTSDELTTVQDRKMVPVQDIKARRATGCELALRHATTVRATMTLPDGAVRSTAIRLSDVVPFIVMKSAAINSRRKPKDCWDVVYCITRFDGGIHALSKAFRSLMPSEKVDEALEILRIEFASVDHRGPVDVAIVAGATESGEAMRIRRDAFERVNELLATLGVQ